MRLSAGLSSRSEWRERMTAVAFYLGASTLGHLVWEFAHLPLYGLWRTASNGELAIAVLHCTAGDFLIATSVLLASLVALRAWTWPRTSALNVAVLTILLGVAYTAFSEWHNVYVRQSWSYGSAMPTLPILGYQIGVSPLAQWLVVPVAAFSVLALSRARSL